MEEDNQQSWCHPNRDSWLWEQDSHRTFFPIGCGLREGNRKLHDIPDPSKDSLYLCRDKYSEVLH
ncbi:hypothetical protein EON65_56325 [archaeon]|nr:MAG: hypothetical protein EON65_56325 [archaeon]